MKDSIQEAYINMLVEMPRIVKSDTPETIAAGANSIRKYIDLNHGDSKSIDSNDKLYHLKHGESDIYYRHDGKNSKELSYISKNIQVGVEKGTDGDSNHIHKFMLHHLENNKSIESSNSNTAGSKKLWINFIKKNPHLKHIAFNSKTLKTTKLTPQNIDHNSDKIWGEAADKSNIRIISTK